MELLGDEVQVNTHFGPFGDIANHDTRLGKRFERI
jgi:hypothetical protein